MSLRLLVCVLFLNVSACGSSNDSDDESQDAPPAAVSSTPASSTPKRPAVQTYTIGADADHPALRNKDGATGSVRDTAIAVMNGDRLEIKPSCLFKEQRKVLDPVVVREDHNVCTQTVDDCIASVPVFQRQCDDQCRVCLKCTPFGCAPWRCCDNVCKDVQTGNRCVATQSRCTQQQNQWKEFSIFPGLDPATMTVKDTEPMKSSALFLEGLTLRFSSLDPSGNSKEVDCPLSSFKPDVDSEKLSLLLRNVDGCAPVFVDGAKSPPILSVVNLMNAPILYSEGLLIKTWDGQVIEQAATEAYLPNIDFLGTLSLFSAPTTN